MRTNISRVLLVVASLSVGGCLVEAGEEGAGVGVSVQALACVGFDPASPDPSFCSGCECDVGEGDCDFDTDCLPGLICGADLGPSVGLPAGWDICIDPASLSCPTFDAASPDGSFCTDSCPCDVGEGDCDTDSQCAAGLICADDLGATVGLPASYDICVDPATFSCPTFSAGSPDPSFCTTSCPCGVGEGDCDADSQCESGLVCAQDLGATVGLPGAYDICVDPATFSCPTFDAASPDPSFCTTDCPCAAGEGDCDVDSQCEAGLVCLQDLGATVGLPGNYDICGDPATSCPAFDAGSPNASFCTPTCPCDSFQGDCDIDADCAGGLTCAQDVGTLAGLPATWDVCLAQCAPGTYSDNGNGFEPCSACPAGQTSDAGANSCYCDMGGKWAVQTKIDVRWPEQMVDGGGFTVTIEAGTATTTTWEIWTQTVNGDGTVDVSAEFCEGTDFDVCANAFGGLITRAAGQTTDPNLASELSPTVFSYDPGGMPAPGDDFDVGTNARVLGIELGDHPTDLDPWPADTAAALAFEADHDNDMLPGITLYVKESGESAQCGAGYLYARPSGDASAAEIDQFYAASRIVQYFDGAVDPVDCGTVTGLLSGPDTDPSTCEQDDPDLNGSEVICPGAYTRFFDCRYDAGGLCSDNGATGAADIAGFDQRANPQVTTGTSFTMKKSSTVTCGTITTLLPE